MFELFASELARVENLLARAPQTPLHEALRTVPLEIFSELLLAVPNHLPALAARLPTMASEEVQRNWTGNHGPVLMNQSLAFVRTLLALWGRRSHRGIEQAQVLDFGCGWGRLLRLLLHAVPEAALFGVDSWDQSIRLCQESGLRCHLAVSDEVPDRLPFAGPFDVIFAFSVFTHLNQATARTVLRTLRQSIRKDGLLCLTIRPVEYWTQLGLEDAATYADRHRQTGFAFLPQNRPPAANGEVTYGKTSLTLDHLAGLADGWRLTDVEWTPSDPMQVIVALEPT
jgi:hypothetical protein